MPGWDWIFFNSRKRGSKHKIKTTINRKNIMCENCDKLSDRLLRYRWMLAGVLDNITNERQLKREIKKSRQLLDEDLPEIFR